MHAEIRHWEAPRSGHIVVPGMDIAGRIGVVKGRNGCEVNVFVRWSSRLIYFGSVSF